jgi:hypothetical protein
MYILYFNFFECIYIYICVETSNATHTHIPAYILITNNNNNRFMNSHYSIIYAFFFVNFYKHIL